MMLSEYFPRATFPIVKKIRRAAPGIRDGAGSEAVHDFRVAIRRLRSALPSARALYGKRSIKRVRENLKAFAKSSNALREEEVMSSTLKSAQLSESYRAKLGEWLARRVPHENALRDEYCAFMEEHDINTVLKQLRAVQQLPFGRDEPVAERARKTVSTERKKLLKLLPRVIRKTGDVELLHRLRILCKQLRYSVEFYESELPPECKDLAWQAREIQRALGELHDIDEALGMLADNARNSIGDPDVELLSALGTALRRLRRDKEADTLTMLAKARLLFESVRL